LENKSFTVAAVVIPFTALMSNCDRGLFVPMPTLPPNIFVAELSVGAVRAELLPASVRVKEPKELVNPPMNTSS
jgi:hypothetical protein